MISRYYPRILASLAVLVFFTNLDVYLFNSQTVSFPPLYLILGFIAVAAPVVFSSASLSMLAQSPLARWCYGFLLISGAWFLFQPTNSDVALQELRTRILSVSFIIVLLCVLRREDVLQWTRRAILAAVFLAVALNVYELFNPSAFSEVTGRSAGFYANPNISGVALIIGLILTIGLLSQRYRLLFALLVGAAVFMTFSRAAMMGWLITMILIMKTGQINLRRSLVIGSVVLALSSVVIISQWEKLQYKLEDLGVLNTNVVDRIQWFNKPVADDDSATDRHDVAEIAYEKFSEQPLLGNGVGASLRLLRVQGDLEISSHNQYLNMMIDHGVLGIFIFPLFVLATVWRARGEAKHIGVTLALFILFMGFFSHNLLQDRYTLLPLALISMLSLASRSVPGTEAQKPMLEMKRAA